FGVLFAMPFAISSEPGVTFFSDRAFTVLDDVALAGLAIAGGVVTVITIFLFRNRNLQVKLGYLILLLWLALGGLAVYWLLLLSPQMPEGSIVHQAGLFVPIGGIVFLLLALMQIRKDTKLVKSMDRLR